MMARAAAAGVERFLLPNIDKESIPALLALEAAYAGRCFAMMGLHPCSVGDDYEEALAAVRDHLDRRDFIAVGEIGIDLYWDKTNLDRQREAFLRQVAWALELDRPIVIHSRESTEVLIELLQQVKASNLRGVFHCFTGDRQQAETIIDMGFSLGIGGVLTFKNGALAPVVAELPLQALVLETDAPYLAPAPYRGRRNESAYVRLVAEKLADVKGIALEEVISTTTANAQKLFDLAVFEKAVAYQAERGNDQ